MYAVIKTGGKQYKVSNNDVIEVEKLNAEPGSTVEFNNVLLIDNGKEVQIGDPEISEAKVVGEVITNKKDDKVIIFKKKRRHNYRRKNGHRQPLTIVRITEIAGIKATNNNEKSKTNAKSENKTDKQKAEKATSENNAESASEAKSEISENKNSAKSQTSKQESKTSEENKNKAEKAN